MCRGAGQRSLPLLQSFYTLGVKAKRSPPGPAPTPLLCLALFSEAGQKIALQVLLACADLEGVGPMGVGHALGEELMIKWELHIFFCHLNTSLPLTIFFPSLSPPKNSSNIIQSPPCSFPHAVCPHLQAFSLVSGGIFRQAK